MSCPCTVYQSICPSAHTSDTNHFSEVANNSVLKCAPFCLGSKIDPKNPTKKKDAFTVLRRIASTHDTNVSVESR